MLDGLLAPKKGYVWITYEKHKNAIFPLYSFKNLNDDYTECIRYLFPSEQ
jgi:hypothetical protein